MKIEYIREFVSLGKYLNFSKAATQLYVSQSTISRHVVEMERELGQKLLRRDSHSVELTLAGQIAFSSCQKILKQYDGLLEQMERLNIGAHGKLDLVESSYAVDRYVNSPLYRFMNSYPNVTVNTSSCEPHDVLQAVLDGRADIGLFICYHPLSQPDLVYYEISQEPCYFCLPESHRLAGCTSLSLSELNGENLIMLRKDTSYTAYLEETLAANNIFPRQRIYLENIDNINAAIHMGNALSIQPEHIQDRSHRGLVYIPISSHDLRARIAFVYLASNKNPAIHLFLDEIKKSTRTNTKK